jgi:kexin
MTDQTLGRLAAQVLCAVVVAIAAECAPADDAVRAKSALVDVPTGVASRVERLQIDDLSASSSRAWRINDDMVSKDGVVPAPTEGFRITSEVVVRSGAPGAPKSLAGMGATPVSGLPGWWRIRLESVGAAIDAADQLRQSPDVVEAFVDVERPKGLRGPTDPAYGLQWHLKNAENPGVDVGAEAAWDASLRGQGVLVGIIEGGWQVDHPDLSANFHALASMPALTAGNHATSVAGLIGADNDNGLGGVGIVPDARISNLIYGSSVENTSAFLWRNDIHDVKNNSWGPIDNGTLGQITPLEREALAASALGRDGLGTVIVWAGGNGFAAGDRTDYDPYASSRFAICVGAIDDDDDKAYYSEPGSSLLVVAHSSGGPGPGDKQIYTTKAGSAYTPTFGGTSTSAPIVAGVVAMMLQANPALSWRDVQHVLVDAARKCDPGSPSWKTNGAGRAVSYDYGFGAVRAMDAVSLATVWHPLGPERATSPAVRTVNTPIPDGVPSGLTRSIVVNDDVVIDAVELTLNVTSTFVGDLAVKLVSPAGTESVLAMTRNDPTNSYVGTLFTSRRPWGERSKGTWSVTIADPVAGDAAFWHDATLRAFGSCPSDVNRDGQTDILDLLDFIDGFAPCVGTRAPCFGAGPAAADYNRDQMIDILDMLDMLEDFSLGC